MPQTTAWSSTSIVAGVPRHIRSSFFVRRSRSTAQKRKLPDGWPPPTRLLTCRGTRSTSGPPMPRHGCPHTAPGTGYARSTATSPGTTNCAPKPSITVVLPCTPTLRTIQGCSGESARSAALFREQTLLGQTDQLGARERAVVGHDQRRPREERVGREAADLD